LIDLKIMDTAFNLQEVGNSVADFGFLIVAAASYIILSTSLFFFFVKWFVRIINGIIERQQNVLDEILNLQKQQKSLLDEISYQVKMRA
jgi:large-conductance mechanosensitive channel